MTGDAREIGMIGTKRKREISTTTDNNEESICSLPVELQEEILLRLPAQSLVKFKSVCKSWHELIVSKRFLKSYHSVWKHRYGEPYGLKGGSWEWHPIEDRTLRAFICLHGTGNWKLVSSQSGLICRGDRACQDRWSYLSRSGIDLSPISKEEGEKIVELCDKYRNDRHRWTYIAQGLPGRSRTRLMIKDWWQNNEPGRDNKGPDPKQ